MSKGFKLFLLLALFAFLSASCGDNSERATATPFGSQVGEPTAIPTYTPVPATPLPEPTITPTPIVVPPSPTPAPTNTPVPTATSVPPPTSTPFPTLAPRPTATTLPTVSGQGTYKEITEAQARNLDGYRALLPTYLPNGYKLARISYSEITGTDIISLIVEFDNDKTQSFYLNTQYGPGLAALPTATPNPSLTPYTPQPSPTPPPLKVGPFPTVGAGVFKQDTVLVRGQAGLLSYSSQFTSLSWTESTSSYALNGVITPDEALDVAKSLQ